MNWNLPNALTLLRIGLIPLFVCVFYLPYGWAFPVSSLIFGLAGLTDWFDGYLARRLNQTSAFGAFLDPVADKLMVAVALVMLVDKHGSDLMLSISAIIIIGREITISALREWMAEQGRRGSVAVSFIGKVKTTVQIISLLFLLWFHPILGVPVYEIGLVLLIVSAALTVWSMIYYLRRAIRDISSQPA
ncbi:MAG: CDP-diacylglycerol--glycerol-3-phosphate 3-phosphatidyltransferase [Gammaproteobacteria bacterium]|jgi:CDP-diacylglycerol--glycerol-3-phosphate 3-phosphatidyltransferase|nr:CDP-diacylglycerol--glycerol-3-phosphate 3-phosphatidyltransferase [Gammaproteobacteria bacterium]